MYDIQIFSPIARLRAEANIKEEDKMNNEITKQILENFLECWKNQQWTEMLKYTRSEWLGFSWENESYMKENFLQAFFGTKKLQKWNVQELIIDEVERKSYQVVVEYLLYDELEIRTFRTVISYNIKFKLPTAQEWAVEPFSCL